MTGSFSSGWFNPWDRALYLSVNRVGALREKISLNIIQSKDNQHGIPSFIDHDQKDPHESCDDRKIRQSCFNTN